MMKWVRRTILALIVLTIVICGWQWRQYSRKIKDRENALLYFKEEDYTKSIRYLKKALKRHAMFSEKLDDDMRCYLADSYFELEEYDKASVIYDSLIDSDDTNPLFYSMKGESYLKAGNDKEAVATFKKGWEKTKDSSFLLKQADLYIARKDYDAALACIDQGLKEDSGHKADFLFEKIIVSESRQDYQAAYEAAKDYVEMYPDDEKAKKEYIFLSTRI